MILITLGKVGRAEINIIVFSIYPHLVSVYVLGIHMV